MTRKQDAQQIVSGSGAVRANGTLTLIVTGIGGTSATRATINYSEVR